jgi:hypothetical protein
MGGESGRNLRSFCCSVFIFSCLHSAYRHRNCLSHLRRTWTTRSKTSLKSIAPRSAALHYCSIYIIYFIISNSIFVYLLSLTRANVRRYCSASFYTTKFKSFVGTSVSSVVFARTTGWCLSFTVALSYPHIPNTHTHTLSLSLFNVYWSNIYMCVV